MNRLLLTVELLSALAAAVFGFLWIQEPTGPYEPYAFMLTLLGTTGTDLARRHFAAKQDRADLVSALIPEISGALERKLREIISQAPSSTQTAVQEAGDKLLATLKQAMREWEQERGAVQGEGQAGIAAFADRVEKSQPEAYGVDESKEISGETTLTSMRLKRKGLEK